MDVQGGGMSVLKTVVSVLIIVMFLPPIAGLVWIAYRDWKSLKEEREKWEKNRKK
jgi:hypothetical protein